MPTYFIFIVQDSINIVGADGSIVKEKWMAILTIVKELRQNIPTETRQHLDYIETNVTNAENNLLDYSEYNCAVRCVLIHLSQAATQAEDQEATVEHIKKYRNQLVTKVDLPLLNQIES